MAIKPSHVMLAVGALAAAPVSAGVPETVRSRIESYRELGAAFKSVNDSLRGDEVQTVLIGQAARQIRNAAQGQYLWFPAGTGPQAGLKTKAKPEIWAQPAKFKAAQDAFAKAATAFQQAVAGRNPAAIRLQAKALGATCKSCHDSFRTRED